MHVASSMALAIILASSTAVAFLLVLAHYARQSANQRAELEARAAHPTRKPEIEPGRLRYIVSELFGGMGLRIVEAEPLGHAGATRLVAVGPGVLRDSQHIIYLEASPAGHIVEAPTLLALAEDVTHNDASLGIVVTPYEIDRSRVAAIAVDLELIDGAALLALVNGHLPARAVEMRSYRLADAGVRGLLPKLHDRVARTRAAGAEG